MCNQTVGLVAAELERQGIATVALQLLREVAEAVRPPRSLFVPYPHGLPLGAPGNTSLQRAILVTAFSMLEDPALQPGAIREFSPATNGARG